MIEKQDTEFYKFIVDADNHNTRIDKFVSKWLPDISRSRIQNLITDQYILVNNNVIKSNYKIKEHDVITMIIPKPVDSEILPEDIPLDILYEDDDLLVVNKPKNMVVHPARGHYTNTLVNALMYHCKDNLSGINGELRPGIVHRIDKDTSGLMVVAKNNKAHQILSDMLSRHEIKRDYIAIVKGEFTSDTATIDAPIGRDKINRKKMAVTADNSKDAITHVKVLKKYKGYTLVKCSLETGRTHQIRVHMAYIGFPIVNDPVYTNDTCTSFGQYLHSTSIDFNHPITGEHLHFEVDPPKEFEEFLSKLEEI
jgi:23S rRNA pseudouridine1911/1915/1917 synthase